MSSTVGGRPSRTKPSYSARRTASSLVPVTDPSLLHGLHSLAMGGRTAEVSKAAIDEGEGGQGQRIHGCQRELLEDEPRQHRIGIQREADDEVAHGSQDETVGLAKDAAELIRHEQER